jgi:deazaflavin-dependent oxidoreductase (nitroreductase family)
LTTVGRRSGKPRTTPLLYVQDGVDLAIVASYGGADVNPAWYLNLEANPSVEVQIRGTREQRRARTAGPDERERLWRKLADVYPSYDDYQRRTDREIPIVVLEPA